MIFLAGNSPVRVLGVGLNADLEPELTLSLPAMDCPHCSSKAKIRSSRTITPTYREIYYQCQALECSFTFKADLSIVCGLAPSGTPNPRVRIPMGNRPGRGPAIPAAANDDVPDADDRPVAANDDAAGEGLLEA